MRLRSRAFLLLITIVGCTDTRVRDGADAELNFRPPVIDLGKVTAASRTEFSFELENSGRARTRLTFAAGARISLVDPPTELGAGAKVRVRAVANVDGEGTFEDRIAAAPDRGEGVRLTVLALAVSPPHCRGDLGCSEEVSDGFGCQLLAKPDGTPCSDTCLTGASCQEGRCVGNWVDCDDDNACTEDFCSPTDGCAHVPRQCGSSGACVAAVCDPVAGCSTEPIEDGTSCGECGASCNSGQCEAENRRCDDGNACTTDACLSDGGCSHEPVTCWVGSECHVATCDTVLGCRNAPAPDGSACGHPGSCLEGTCTAGSCVVAAPVLPTSIVGGGTLKGLSQSPAGLVVEATPDDSSDIMLTVKTAAGTSRWDQLVPHACVTSPPPRHATVSGDSIWVSNHYAVREIDASDGGLRSTAGLTPGFLGPLFADAGVVSIKKLAPMDGNGFIATTGAHVAALDETLQARWRFDATPIGLAVDDNGRTVFDDDYAGVNHRVVEVEADGGIRWSVPRRFVVVGLEGDDVFGSDGSVLSRSGGGALRFKVPVTGAHALADGDFAAFAISTSSGWRVVRFNRITGAAMYDTTMTGARTDPMLAADHSIWSLGEKGIPRPTDSEPSAERFALQLKSDGTLVRHCLPPRPYYPTDSALHPHTQLFQDGLWFGQNCGDDCDWVVRAAIPGVAPASGWSTFQGGAARNFRPGP